MSDKTLLLVDGSSYLFRAFHALPDLRNKQGEPTGAIHGMVGMLRRLKDDTRLHGGATIGAVIFDAPGKTFRDDWYDQYKANRSETPPDLVSQIAPIHELVMAMGWPLLALPGVEADDVIATLVEQAATQGIRSVVSTGDKDLAQLVSDHCQLVNTMTRDGSPPELMDRDGVVARFGVPPERIIDYLSLVGDAVDNVPGVDKVGPKTAAKWIAEYGSLDEIVARAGEVKGKVGENLRAALDWLPTARKLVTVKRDCDLSGYVDGLGELELKSEDASKLMPLFERWGLRTFARQLGAGNLDGRADTAAPSAANTAAHSAANTAAHSAAHSAPAALAAASVDTVHRRHREAPADKHYETVSTQQQLDEWLARIESAELTSFDTETTSLDPMQAEIVGISLSTSPFQGCYIPLAHDYAGAPEQLDRAATLERLRPWLESDTHRKVGQNLKYDMHVLENAGIRMRGIEHDTLLQSYVLEAHRTHGMDALAARHLERETIRYEQVAGKGAKQIPFSQVPVDRASEYAAEDADVTMDLHEALWPQVRDDEKLHRIYSTIEMPVMRVLQSMERNGVLIDAQALQRQSDAIAKELIELECKAGEAAGQSFNLGSPKQLGEILFGQLKLPVVKKTASGAPSTDEEVLEKLAEDYPLPRIVLDWRGLSKLKSTYTDKLPKMVNPRTGRVHTNYAQAVAVTGRLSSNEPNLQNIPVRTAEGRRIREAFIAPEGSVIVSADYSQVELRIMAHISEDPSLLKAFADGEDVHRATASEVFGVPLPEVSSEQRRYAKVINFGLIYGMSAFGLASNLGIERQAAKNYIERYFSRYPGVAAYMERTREQAHAQGYVETVLGRRLWLAEINSPNGPRRSAAERAAINAPMQGTAADLIKLAMIEVDRWLRDEGLKTRLIMQVHDELVLEVPEGELERVKAELPARMAGVAELRVPLLAEVGAGANWEKAH